MPVSQLVSQVQNIHTAVAPEHNLMLTDASLIDFRNMIETLGLTAEEQALLQNYSLDDTFIHQDLSHRGPDGERGIAIQTQGPNGDMEFSVTESNNHITHGYLETPVEHAEAQRIYLHLRDHCPTARQTQIPVVHNNMNNVRSFGYELDRHGVIDGQILHFEITLSEEGNIRVAFSVTPENSSTPDHPTDHGTDPAPTPDQPATPDDAQAPADDSSSDHGLTAAEWAAIIGGSVLGVGLIGGALVYGGSKNSAAAAEAE